MRTEASVAFPLPGNELQRSTALREYRIIRTAPELACDELTRRLSRQAVAQLELRPNLSEPGNAKRELEVQRVRGV